MPTLPRHIQLVGYASGIAASHSGCDQGPHVLKDSAYFKALNDQGLQLHWAHMVEPTITHSIAVAVQAVCTKLANVVCELVQQQQFFTVIGGDHSCAIGTWSGVHQAISPQGDLGLIWIDAHLDSHTPLTSETGNIHGMPVACLMGHGDEKLTQILSTNAKIKPENLCIIGARSFEAGEAALLKSLNVRVFFMDEVLEKGLSAVMEEAIKVVSENTVRYGLTLDIDSINPLEAPATGVSEPGGLNAAELCQALGKVKHDHA